MKKVVRFISLALSAMMIFALTACAGANAKWVVTVDGVEIPTGQYLYYQFSAYQQAASKVTDTKTNVLKQKIEDQDATVWIYNKTIEQCKRKVAIDREFEKLGLTLTADDQASIEQTAEYILSLYGTLYEKNGIGKETVKNAVTVEQKNSAIFNKYYGKGGLEEVKEETLKDYFVNNYAVIYAFGTSVSGADDATKEKTKTAANNALASVKSGKKITEAAAAFNKEINPDSEVTAGDTDDNYKMTVKKDDANYPQALRDAIFAAKADEPFIYDQDDYETVILRKDVKGDTTTFESVKSSILSVLKSTELSEKITALGKDLSVTEDKAAISYYSAKNIKQA